MKPSSSPLQPSLNEQLEFKIKTGDKCIYEGKVFQALECYSEALAPVKNEEDIDIDLVCLFRKIGFCKLKLSDYEKALFFTEKALEIQLSEGEDFLENVRIYVLLGEIYLEQANYPKALTNLEKSLEILNEYEKEPGDSIACYNALGWYYLEQGELQRAMTYTNRAIQVGLEYLSDHKSNIASTYRLMRDIQLRLMKYNESLASVRKALELLKELHGKQNHPDMIPCYTTLGQIFSEQKEHKSASEEYKKGTNILREFNCQDQNSADLVNQMASLLMELAVYPEAKSGFDEYLEKKTKVFGVNHPKICVYLQQNWDYFAFH